MNKPFEELGVHITELTRMNMAANGCWTLSIWDTELKFAAAVLCTMPDNIKEARHVEKDIW